MQFKKILIANRGEIARRIIHACRELDIVSVAIYSQEDAESLYVKEAGEAYLLNGAEIRETYLNIQQIIEIAQRAGVDAVHPGYGFLSENAEFAQKCAEVGIKFIGPSPEALIKLGDKLSAKSIAHQAQVPTVPGYEGEIPQGEELFKIAENIGYPLLVKAAAGGGGKGMRVVEKPEDLLDALEVAQREGLAYFGNDRVFIERYLLNPRHIEVQILGDEHGSVIHLYERECSLQRRHQKVIEEAPSPSISESTRQALCEAAVRLAQSARYASAGTVEFIVDSEDQFYFLEVNTRLQVEHPVTEAVTGVDLVQAQIAIAQGEELAFRQEDISLSGHAIECRLYAEDPENDFLPAEGVVGVLEEPHRPGVRIDSSLAQGQDILPIFDPMLAKLISFGASRKIAISKIDALLRDYVLLGVRHNIDFLRFLVQSTPFQKGRYHTHSVQPLLEEFQQRRKSDSLPEGLWALGALLSQSSSSPNFQSSINCSSAENVSTHFQNLLFNFKNV